MCSSGVVNCVPTLKLLTLGMHVFYVILYVQINLLKITLVALEEMCMCKPAVLMMLIGSSGAGL